MKPQIKKLKEWNKYMFVELLISTLNKFISYKFLFIGRDKS